MIVSGFSKSQWSESKFLVLEKNQWWIVPDLFIECLCAPENP
jgi:hypothetical protein